MGGQIDLVDDQQVALDDAGAALARDVVSAGHVDHEHPVVDQIQREGRCEVVAAALDQDQLQAGELGVQTLRRLDVEGRVLADDGVGAGSGLHRQHPFGVDQLAPAQALGVFPGDEVVGDDGKVHPLAPQQRDQPFHQRRLAGTDRSADADPRSTDYFRGTGHRSMYLRFNGTFLAGAQVSSAPSA